MRSSVVEVVAVSLDLGANPVLRGVDLSATAGEIVAVLGANGAGKSTLLRCLAGTRGPDGGTVRIRGAAPSGTPAFWRDVAVLADQPSWYPGLTVREHLELVRVAHRPVPAGTPGVEELLRRFGLLSRADASPLTLSTGQRQRLLLAAIFGRPSRLMLLDEPEAGLDADVRVTLASLLAGYAAAGGTVVMATHDADLARRCRARIVSLVDGVIAVPGGAGAVRA